VQRTLLQQGDGALHRRPQASSLAVSAAMGDNGTLLVEWGRDEQLLDLLDVDPEKNRRQLMLK